MIVNVNNKAVETSASTLSQLVEELHLPENGVAVGVDNRMVPRATWHEYQLSEGMNLVIIKAPAAVDKGKIIQTIETYIQYIYPKEYV